MPSPIWAMPRVGFWPRLLRRHGVGVSEVMGLRENKNGKSGIVMVRSRGFNQHGNDCRICALGDGRKRDPSAPAPEPVMPQLADAVAPADLVPPPEGIGTLDSAQSGSDKYFDDYETGMFIDHHDGMTLEDSEHMLATRLYQNTARVHFDGLAQQETRFGKRLIYGGHIISHARAMSFNGLENAVCVAGLNAGTHAAPAFAGDTIYAGTRIVDKAAIAGVEGVGAMRLRHFVTKNKPVGDITELVSKQKPRPNRMLLLVWTAGCGWRAANASACRGGMIGSFDCISYNKCAKNLTALRRVYVRKSPSRPLCRISDLSLDADHDAVDPASGHRCSPLCGVGIIGLVANGHCQRVGGLRAGARYFGLLDRAFGFVRV